MRGQGENVPIVCCGVDRMGARCHGNTGILIVDAEAAQALQNSVYRCGPFEMSGSSLIANESVALFRPHYVAQGLPAVVNHLAVIKDEMWPAILAIQEQAYELVVPESLTVLRFKWLMSPDTCLVGLDAKHQVHGYFLGHPWKGSKPPSLYQDLLHHKLSKVLFLHDLAISKQARGWGLARILFQRFRDNGVAAGSDTLELISVQSSIGFWKRLDFSVVSDVLLPESYGSDATYMRLSL